MRRRILATVLLAAVVTGCGQPGAVRHGHPRVGVTHHRTPVHLVSGPAPAPAQIGPSSPMVVFDEIPQWI